METIGLKPQNPGMQLDNGPTAFIQVATNILPDQISGSVTLPPPISSGNVNAGGPLIESVQPTDGTVDSVNGYGTAKLGPAHGPATWLQLNHVASSVHEPASGAKKLRKMLLETNELIICPGVYDGLSARTAIELGFDAMYMVSIYCLSFFPLFSSWVQDSN
jgi:hypothetical protein